MINDIDNFYVFVRLNNLSKNELSTLSEKNMVYVKDPNTYPKELSLKESIIIHEEELSKRARKDLQAEFIRSKELRKEEIDDFILIKRQDLDKRIDKMNIFSKIIEDYKKKRSN